MKSSLHTSPAFLLLLLGCLVAVSEAATFTCNATTSTTCLSVIGYVSTNTSTYGKISAFFQVPLSSILGANDLLITTPGTTTVSAGSTVKIPVPCLCTKGIGRSNHMPNYTIESGDGLDAIARVKFDNFINYTEIADANDIPDPNKIMAGDTIWIPLPCSCDPVEEQKVVHLAYKVKSGDNTSYIATTFGTSESTLLKLNGISDPKSLQADQILDVPMKACASSINDTSPDHGLLLPGDTYTFTAKDCVKCSCSSSSYALDCSLASNRNRTCPAATCSGNLTLGESNGTGCDATICAYTGYSNTTSSFNILTTTTTNQTASCKNAAARHTGSAAAFAWMKLVVLLHLILTSICFL